ncbi:MAG: hypothetical protein FJX60_14420 [Alphaproteobacteria bacterium]|nr:hypothetical protein [Alphaproteobacteria bacterium]
MPFARILLALALVALPLASAGADPKRIAFPEGYEKTWLPYAVHNRPDNGQVRHLFANPVAVEAAKDGKPVPGHGYETVRCAGYAANLNSVAASDARALCSALI